VTVCCVSLCCALCRKVEQVSEEADFLRLSLDRCVGSCCGALDYSAEHSVNQRDTRTC
jgi:hypothetical protein